MGVPSKRSIAMARRRQNSVMPTASAMSVMQSVHIVGRRGKKRRKRRGPSGGGASWASTPSARTPSSNMRVWYSSSRAMYL